MECGREESGPRQQHTAESAPIVKKAAQHIALSADRHPLDVVADPIRQQRMPGFVKGGADKLRGHGAVSRRASIRSSTVAARCP
jgi:hypothetical protein